MFFKYLFQSYIKRLFFTNVVKISFFSTCKISNLRSLARNLLSFAKTLAGAILGSNYLSGNNFFHTGVHKEHLGQKKKNSQSTSRELGLKTGP